jgi:hypothetical protein
MEANHEPLHSKQWSFLQWKIMDIAKSLILIDILIDRAFKYGYGAIFWGYVGRNYESPCVEFCNFVQCYMFVNYLTCYY